MLLFQPKISIFHYVAGLIYACFSTKPRQATPKFVQQ